MALITSSAFTAVCRLADRPPVPGVRPPASQGVNKESWMPTQEMSGKRVMGG